MICILICLFVHVQYKYNEGNISVSACIHPRLSIYCSTSVRHVVCVWSQVFSGLVLRLRGREVILQEGLQVLKGVPLVGLAPPALHHQFMERGGAARGAGHPVAPLHLLQHLTVVHA